MSKKVFLWWAWWVLACVVLPVCIWDGPSYILGVLIGAGSALMVMGRALEKAAEIRAEMS